MTTPTLTAAVIHPTAIVDPQAQLGQGVVVGPYCVVEAPCQLGNNVVLEPHVHIKPYVRLGDDCKVGSHAVLGGHPQDSKFKGEVSWVQVGQRTKLGEMVTLHRATGEGQVTTVGDDCFLMAYVHVGHNTQVGNRVTLANAVQLAGHVTLMDDVTIGGSSAIHQFCVVGRRSMIGGVSGLRQDVPPFTLGNGSPTKLIGLNTVGLIRAGLSSEVRKQLKRAYRTLFIDRSDNTFTERVARTQTELGHVAEVAEMLEFIQKVSKRGIITAELAIHKTKPEGLVGLPEELA
jgi:UDP-N-acetylglucosamine acyltransferase